MAYVRTRGSQLAIVLSGYPAEMESFLDANPGLRSRFARSFGPRAWRRALQLEQNEIDNRHLQ